VMAANIFSFPKLGLINLDDHILATNLPSLRIAVSEWRTGDVVGVVASKGQRHVSDI
jgi:hypothetical protein